MSSFQSLSTKDVSDGTATIFGLEQSFLKKEKFFSKAQGVLLFIHGFNSSAEIWGNQSEGFVSSAIKKKYIPFVIDFSDSFNGSIVNLADQDLFFLFEFVRTFLKDHFTSQQLPIHFVAHSMGGIILRYFLSFNHKHTNHTAEDLKKSNLKSAALLGVPNHGISKSNSDNLVSKMEKFIMDFNALAGKKYTLKLANKAFFQLLSGNSIIDSLLENLSSNMWPELFWMNFIGNRDIVVDKNSSFFPTEEVEYLQSNFYQMDFDATHMRNPFHSFTNALVKKIPFTDSKFFSRIEKKTPDFLSFLTKDPIYANTSLIEDYFSRITAL